MHRGLSSSLVITSSSSFIQMTSSLPCRCLLTRRDFAIDTDAISDSDRQGCKLHQAIIYHVNRVDSHNLIDLPASHTPDINRYTTLLLWIEWPTPHLHLPRHPRAFPLHQHRHHLPHHRRRRRHRPRRRLTMNHRLPP